MDNLEKGYKMEEALRNYFLDSGFFVVRGIKFNYEGFEITDVDLWLYNRPSSITRERIIVDIKNKKTPQAIERIFWTKGLMQALNLNDCLVATTERRESVRDFGLKNGVTVLDGHFLSKLKEPRIDRLSEEELYSIIQQAEDPKFKDDWRKRYERSKSVLLGQMDYSGCNAQLSILKYFIEQCVINKLKADVAARMLYILISHILVVIDFLLKDLSFLDAGQKGQRLSDGFRFGSLGKAGLERTLDLAIKISGQSSGSIKTNFLKIYESIPVEILREFFVKNENSKRFFQQAKLFESYAYSRSFINPNELNSELRGIISVLLDFHNIDRNRFFSAYPNSDTQQLNIDLTPIS